MEFGLDIEPELGTADSGDIEIDLPSLFVTVAEAAEERQTALAIFIDEIQYLKRTELSALIMAMHKMQQKQLPLVLVGAGLPILPSLAGESKSYAKRLFNFPSIGSLSESEVAKALQGPVKMVGVDFEAAALKEIFRLTQGHPYFLQEWGYQAWNRAESRRRSARSRPNSQRRLANPGPSRLCWKQSVNELNTKWCSCEKPR